MPRKPAKNTWWMIRDNDGLFWHHTARYTRSLCVSDFVVDCQAAYRDPPYTPTWRDLVCEGYDCVRVEIRVLEKK
jgi:hypothetical protein